MSRAGSAIRWLVALVGVAVTGAAAAQILGQVTSGAQPWSGILSDSIVLGQAVPFALGLGLLAGLVSGRRPRSERRARDGAIRRFGRGTVAMHWLAILGFLLALPTGAWQYLGGIVDVHPPFELYLLYRVHYIGAAIVLFVSAWALTHWWLSGERSLLLARSRLADHLRGLAYELPRPAGLVLAALLRIDMAQRPPQTGKFTFYETVFSFPSWAFVIALITVTGIVKAVRYVYPVPGEILFWASTLHVAAMVMIALKLLDHVRYTLARWPLMVAIVTGWVSERYVRLVHPGWHREVEAAEAPLAAAAAPAGHPAASALGGEE